MKKLDQQPQPGSETYADLIYKIDEGKIRIPKFQRNFVWSLDRTAQLLDSIIKGYPIGTFILWETTERLNDVKKIGNQILSSVTDGSEVLYVLDGQQRITSIYAAFKGEEVQREGERKATDYSKIYVDLEAGKGDGQIIVTKKPSGKNIALSKMFDFSENFSNMQDEFSPEQVRQINQYSEMLNKYSFSTIVLCRNDIDSAVEVFTRINTGGKTLDLFDLISAKTYDESQNFDMEKKFKKFLKKLKEAKYGKIPHQIVLEILSLIESGECSRKKILQTNKESIIQNWDNVILSIERTIDYFRSTYGVFNSSVLPYDALIVPFAYFIFKKKKKPTGKMSALMKEFFWRMSLSHRYVEGRGTKLAQDAKRVECIMGNKRPEYGDIEVDMAPRYLIDSNFSISNSYCKAILCLLASQAPRDFDEHDNKVILDSSFLVAANSKNYHHFFPKAFLREGNMKKGNSVVNITLVSAALNQEIRDNPPSKYIPILQKDNKKLSETLKSHLIEDIEGFGINGDDYGVFLQKRAEAICRELEKRINPES